jgi:hypothetical protein
MMTSPPGVSGAGTFSSPFFQAQLGLLDPFASPSDSRRAAYDASAEGGRAALGVTGGGPGVAGRAPAANRGVASGDVGESAVESFYGASRRALRLQSAPGFHDYATPDGRQSAPQGAAGAPAYAGSYRLSESKDVLASNDTVSPDDENADLFYARKAAELLRELRVENSIDQLEESMRLWCARELVSPLLQESRRNMAQLVRVADLLLQDKATNRLPPEELGLLQRKEPELKLAEWLVTNCANHPMGEVREVVSQRARLSRFLDAGSQAARPYVLHRLTQLATNGYMSAFRWDGGGEWNGSKWRSHLPSDSKIILHVFCTRMDDYVRGFSRNHYVELADEEARKREHDLALVEARALPPYVFLQHRRGRWYPQPGRNVVFQALVLFVLFVKRHLDGRVEQMRLSDKSLGDLASLVP